MTLKRPTPILLALYTALSAYILGRSALGLPFQMWSGFIHPLLALACVLSHSWEREGRQRTAIFAVLVTLSTLLAESIGVATGLLFGSYHYTDRFGPLLFGLVPFVIPIVWLNMMYPSYRIASQIAPRRGRDWIRWLGVAALGGLVMTSWDLAVDPGMVYKGHWVWETPGGYFGIPWSNFFGWWLTTFATLMLYQWVVKARGTRRAPDSDRPMLILYAVTGLHSVIGDWLIGLYGPALVGLGAIGLWVIWGWQGSRSHLKKPSGT